MQIVIGECIDLTREHISVRINNEDLRRFDWINECWLYEEIP